MGNAGTGVAVAGDVGAYRFSFSATMCRKCADVAAFFWNLVRAEFDAGFDVSGRCIQKLTRPSRLPVGVTSG